MGEPLVLPENPTLEEVRDFFTHDTFAARTGCTILEASAGHSMVELILNETHRNAVGGVMGGVIFTMADFAVAIASNIGNPPTVSVSMTVDFMNATRGNVLVATCDVEKQGSRLGFYTVTITDDTARHIARVTATVSCSVR
jgi:acyl-CoA thioesterase